MCTCMLCGMAGWPDVLSTFATYQLSLHFPWNISQNGEALGGKHSKPMRQSRPWKPFQAPVPGAYKHKFFMDDLVDWLPTDTNRRSAWTWSVFLQSWRLLGHCQTENRRASEVWLCACTTWPGPRLRRTSGPCDLAWGGGGGWICLAA